MSESQGAPVPQGHDWRQCDCAVCRMKRKATGFGVIRPSFGLNINLQPPKQLKPKKRPKR